MNTRKPRKPTRAAREAFAVAMQSVLAHVGAVQRTSNDVYETWYLSTKAGVLEIHLSPSEFFPGGAVNARFHDVDRACDLFGVRRGDSNGFLRAWVSFNGYSGKWNHTYYDVPLAAAVDDLQRDLLRVRSAP